MIRLVVPLVGITAIFISFLVLVRTYQARDRREHELELQERREEWADRLLNDDPLYPPPRKEHDDN